MKNYYQLIFMGAIDHKLLPNIKESFLEKVDELIAIAKPEKIKN